MRTATLCVALASALAAGLAHAETVKVACHGKEVAEKPYDLTFVYESGDPSTLKVSGSYGEFTLPAGKSVNEGPDPEGGKIVVTNIWGSADLNLPMPDKAALEACIRKRLTPEQATDSDIVFSTVFPCAAETPMGAPVPVKVSAQLSILDPQSVLLTMKRTYVEKTDLPDGTIALEPLPPPECTVQ